MSFDLTDDWVWDFWVVDDPDSSKPAYHLFFLKAPRTLVDPDLRHVNASIGHAVSSDLKAWTRVGDALGPQAPGAFDDLANWTGCIVRGDDTRWHLFTTGVSHADQGAVQRIGVSHSTNLHHWTPSKDVLLEADQRWYRRRSGSGPDEHWRDPWVVRDERGLWHMYVTAQATGNSGHGVVGHATSVDLRSWDIGPPLSQPTGRFDQLEVISLSQVEGRWVLLFSCMGPEMPGARLGDGGVWAVAVDGPGTPVDIASAVRLSTEDLYVGKLVTLRDGTSRFLAFENRDEGGQFVGGVIDPCGVRWNTKGDGLELLDGRERWRPRDDGYSQQPS